MKSLMLAEQAPQTLEAFYLPASAHCVQGCSCVRSPYLGLQNPQRVGNTGRDIKLILANMASRIGLIDSVVSDGPTPGVYVHSWDDTTPYAYHGLDQYDITISGAPTQSNVHNAILAAAAAFATSQGWTYSALGKTFDTDADVNALIAAAIPPAPSSYQTIVSQTGTSAPAVSGSLSPMSTYPAGTTFTWARTGAGVYTLTASTAVFNTSGKTGVFVAPLQNLNAQAKAVVTSSTVITVTTAVASVAVLGLLGLTTTPTDALLNQTMIYVQTYS